MVAAFRTATAAARAVVAIGRTVRPSMLELMDSAGINAVEDYKPMGVDRDAGALLIAQSDAPATAAADEVAVEIPVVAHAGDGNAHPIIVFDPRDPDAAAQQAFERVMTLAISLGGTITGEHGVGRTKKGALPAQLGADVMALSHRIKHALDPRGMLNPGAVL